MSDEAHFAWAAVCYWLLNVVLVVGCTTAVAYWAHTSYGLLSMLIPLFTSVGFGNQSSQDDETD